MGVLAEIRPAVALAPQREAVAIGGEMLVGAAKEVSAGAADHRCCASSRRSGGGGSAGRRF
jgi:hypothetical protein